MYRSVIFVSIILLISLLASPAMATTADEIAGGAIQGVFVSPDAGSVDTEGLRTAVSDAQSNGLELTVAVLGAEPETAVALAEKTVGVVGGTVLVLTPTEYAVFSDEMTQSDMNKALDSASSELSGLDEVVGVKAFVEAASAQPRSWGWVLAAVIGVLMLVGIVGRVVEQKASRGRREKSLEKTQATLLARADRLADPIIDLSTKVDLADNEAANHWYREATDLFATIRSELEKPATPESVDKTTSDLEQLDRLLGRITDAVE